MGVVNMAHIGYMYFMARPAVLTAKKLVALDPKTVQAIEDFRFSNRIKAESEAIRQLIARGLTPVRGELRPALETFYTAVLAAGRGDEWSVPSDATVAQVVQGHMEEVERALSRAIGDFCKADAGESMPPDIQAGLQAIRSAVWALLPLPTSDETAARDDARRQKPRTSRKVLKVEPTG